MTDEVKDNLKLAPYREAICRWYVDERATVQTVQTRLKEEFGVHAALGTITRTLEIWDGGSGSIKREDSKHKKHYPINHAAFDNLDDPKVREWLDFLVKHANLGKNNTVIVSVHPRDLTTLIEFRQFIGTSKGVELPKDNRIRIRVYSKSIWQRVYDAKQAVA